MTSRSDSKQPGRRAERLAAVCAWSVAALIAGAFGWLVFDLFREGFGRLSWTFLTTAPQDAGRAGGIATVLISTGLVLAVCLAVALPLGVGCAAFLTEFTRPGSRASRLVRRSLDLLASVPSIVFGLFGMVFFCQVLKMGFSILAGGLTLACMVLPIVVRTTYAGFRTAPEELRLGAAALGLTRTTTLWHLLLPAAVHGVVVGLMLGLGRAAAETAALIFTSGYVTRMPHSLFDSGRTLSVHVYDLAMNVPGGSGPASASALTLLVLLLGINLVASRLTERWLRAKVAA